MSSNIDTNESLDDFHLAKKNVINLLNELKINLSRVNSSDFIRNKINIRKDLDMFIEAIIELIQENLNSIDDMSYLNFIDQLLIPKEIELDYDKSMNIKYVKFSNSKVKSLNTHEVYNLDQKIDYFHIFLKSTFQQLILYVNQKESFQRENEQNEQNLKIKAEKSYNYINKANIDLRDHSNNLKQELEKTINENIKITEKLYNLENQPSIAAYDLATTKYRDLEKKYRWGFYLTLASLITSTLVLIFNKSWIVQLLTTESLNPSNILYELWAIKISVVLIGITLISYFLKQSTHYQKLADQTYQTQTEIKAFPTFMNSVPPEQTIEIRKQLALKYFGKEIDGSSHKNMSNLITDQMKSTTEMVKAVTEVIKKPEK